MKKIFCLLIAAAMIFSFAACSSEPSDENGASESGSSESGSSESSSSETEDEIVPERGTVENNSYRNDAFKVGFDADENWYFLTDAEIAETMGVAEEMMYGEEIPDDADLIYDLYCVNNVTSDTVSISYEDLGIIGGAIDEKTYLETVLAQLEGSGVGSGVSDPEIRTVTIDGNEYSCLYLGIDVSGVTVHENIVVKKIGNWISVITVASLDEAELENILARASFE